MSRLLLTLFLAFASLSAFSQNTVSYWKRVQGYTPAYEQTPNRFAAFSLDQAALRAALQSAPMEFSALSQRASAELAMPSADGTMRFFRMVESPILAPELAEKYPAIRTYSGATMDGWMIRLSTGYNGINGFVTSPEGVQEIIMPAERIAGDIYIAFRKSDLPAGAFETAFCGTPDEAEELYHSFAKEMEGGVNERSTSAVTLKRFRLAVATTGEYAQFHGGSKPLVMSAITVAVNYVNSVMERDFGVRMDLIPNNDTLIYLDKDTDPFTGNLDSWIGQNHTIVNQLIGSANYDIGHVLAVIVPGSPIAGLAGGRVCSSFGKGRGGSSLGQPVGVNFYDIIAHEMCHQLSGSHTWNQCTDDIANQLAPGTAYEPGSGSTIMSYAGSCGPNNVVNGNDSYFHAASIRQVNIFVYDGDGQTCGSLDTTINNQPEVSIPLQNGFRIPISTPFKLTAEGFDPDGDPISYCWEQWDLGPSVPLGTSTLAVPIFRSRQPTTNPTRIFPQLSTIASNQFSNTEILPDYTRQLNFRCTVRDNRPGFGGQAWANVQFFTTDQAGPFRVSYPSASGLTWRAGEYQTVTWDVANTDVAPVNCKTVNIRMSTNGGQSFPITLASGVPNIGRACVRVPNVSSTQARIWVEAADNIFFDISNFNLSIVPATTPAFSICPGTLSAQVCLPETFTAPIGTAGLAGFDTLIQLSVNGLPAGATADISPNPVAPGQDAMLTVTFAAGAAEGQYDIELVGAAGSVTSSIQTELTLVSNDYSMISLVAPANGAEGVTQAPLLRWAGSPDANRYEIQIATNPNFESAVTVFSNSNVIADSLQANSLEKGTIYYWRIRPVNECGPGAWTDPFVFGTAVQSCLTYNSNDLPKNISANGTPTIESKISVTAGPVNDVNVKSITGNHNFFKDLDARLIGPGGQTVLLFTNICPQVATFNIGFDDAASGTLACPPPNNGALFKPFESLSVFNGVNGTGDWTLRVKDNVISSGGSLTGFQLELCFNSAVNAPFIVNNNPLSLPGGTNAAITTDLLLTQDADNTADQLVYTIVTLPKFGRLEKNGNGGVKVGDQFTQAELNNGAIRFFDFGNNAGTDSFRFVVTDGAGGFAGGAFVFQPIVSTDQPVAMPLFDLSPNPANEYIRLFFPQMLTNDGRLSLFSLTGQQILSLALPSGINSYTLPVQDLPQGMYIIHVENRAGKFTRKVVKQ
jgi:subtilisin-like proprotein convertase family protein